METTFIYNRNPLLILSYISRFQGQANGITATEISRKLSLSIGSVYQILKELNCAGLLEGTRIGHATLYKPVLGSPVIKQFRILDNQLYLLGLIKQLKGTARKIILYGSCARGDDTIESDIDLFLLVDEDKQPYARRIISGYSHERMINPVIADSMEYLDMQENDHVFYNEIKKGLVLWGDD